MTTSTTVLGSKVGRARRSLGQLWQVPTFLIGLLAFVGVAASTPWRVTPQQREFDEMISRLRTGLEQGEDPNVLVGIAENVVGKLPRFRSRAAEAHFLVGSAFYRQAKAKSAVLAKDIWPRAVEHLDQALKLGGSDEDRIALQYRLGFSLYQLNQDVPRSLELMTLSVEKGADQPLPAYRLLVEAHLAQKAPNFDAALTAARRVIDLTPERETEAIAKGRVQIGELLLRKGMRAEAIKEMDRITSKAPRAVRVQARLLQAQACEDDGQWTKAIPLWQGLLADAPHVPGGRARICYALGWCHQQKDSADTQESIRFWQEALKLGGPAGQAAGLRLGQLRLALAPGQALADWTTALASTQPNELFRNPYVEIEQVREWLDQAIRHLDVAQDPEKTQTVAELYRRITPGSDSDYRIAQAAEAVAKQRAEQYKTVSGNVTAEEVQAQYRRAAAAFELAAKARPEAERSEPLWRCAQCYLAARDTAQAQQVLVLFVQFERDETRLAEGWFTLGDLYRSAQDRKTARDAYLKCIEIPNTPFANRARYHLAMEEKEQKNYTKAREILEQILSKSRDVDLRTQEKAQYQMTSVLMLMAEYDRAHVELKEFIHRFPENANTLLAREQLGECCRQLAKNELLKEVELRKSITLTSSEELRQTVNENLNKIRISRNALLTESIKACEALSDELEKKARTKPLDPIEQILRRRAQFGIGECYFYGERYFDALHSFRELQGKNRRTVEGFYACLYICDLVGVLQQPPKRAEQARESAKEAIRLLQEDLKGLAADAEIFRMPGIRPREWWVSWADTEQRKLTVPPRPDNEFP